MCSPLASHESEEKEGSSNPAPGRTLLGYVFPPASTSPIEDPPHTMAKETWPSSRARPSGRKPVRKSQEPASDGSRGCCSAKSAPARATHKKISFR